MQFWKRLPLSLWLAFAAVAVYLFTRFFQLTSLPVFADEAIYIRWAQLLAQDSKFLFFPLNDGKPPLFIWSLVPALQVFDDPVFAGRAVSAVIGLAQMAVIWFIIKQLKGGRIAQAAGVVTVLIAPFWFFHHRMALMDSLLTFGLSLAWLGFLFIDRVPPFKNFNARSLRSWLLPVFLAGGGWGIALLTKTPALFFAPAFFLWAVAMPQIWQPRWNPSLLFQRLLLFGVAGALGLGIFSLLKLSPAFGSLFGRSTDFTYSLSELLQGEWRSTLQNFPKVLNWLSTYMRPELLSLPLFALLLSRQKLLHGKILLSAFLWALPLLLFGRVLHARYFLPLAPFLTVSAALFFEEIWELVRKHKENLYVSTVFALLIVFFFIGCLRFVFFAFFTPSQIPFVLDDREQYLTEWSSGHGILEFRDRLFERAQRGERTVVVTEGSFGTLPDGLLLYFDQRPEVEHVRIDGLVQYPVREIPQWVREEARTTETWLVVNAHRLALEPETNGLELIDQIARPYGAPSLQLYRVLPE